MKYLIHACPSRMWYVQDYLLPQLTEQGADSDEVAIWNDAEGRGNLFSFVESCRYLGSLGGGVWHLQDDVVLSRDFVARTRTLEDLNPHEVQCGFCFPVGSDPGINCRGRTPVKFLWYSFQCIYIPNSLAGEFARWFLDEAQYWGKYREKVAERKHDDWFFREFLLDKHPHDHVEHIVPNLVDHVDYLIGGTTLTPLRARKVNHGVYWEEPEIVEYLRQRLSQKTDSRQ